MDIKIYRFVSTDWELLSDNTERITIKNSSGYAVEVVETLTNEKPTTPNKLLTVTLGGISNEFEASENRFVWGKTSNLAAFLRIREFGTLDPEIDPTYLAAEQAIILKTLNDHLNDKEDPHDTTKEQVGLSNIPNSISDDPSLKDKTDVAKDDPLYVDTKQILATIKAANTLLNNIEAHKKTKNEDHKIDKAAVGLGLVPNWSPASTENALDPNM